MPSADITGLLGTWAGYRVGTVGRFEVGELGETGAQPEVLIELIRRPGPMICSGCGRSCDKTHDWQERGVRALPILDAPTPLCVQRFRVACPHCGPRVERRSWLERHARVTNRLAESVARLCRDATVQAAAEFYGLSWDAAKAIDKAYLQRTLGEPDLSGVTLLALDEFAVKKGHRDATIFVEPLRQQVLWVCQGRGREDLRPFFEKLGEEGRRRVQAVAMDLNGAYEAEVKAQCPQSRIVFDQFHVVA